MNVIPAINRTIDYLDGLIKAETDHEIKQMYAIDKDYYEHIKQWILNKNHTTARRTYRSMDTAARDYIVTANEDNAENIKHIENYFNIQANI